MTFARSDATACPYWLKCQQLGAACKCSRRPRDYSAQLAQARADGDWNAHARIWEERRLAAVDHDERQLDPR